MAMIISVNKKKSGGYYALQCRSKFIVGRTGLVFWLAKKPNEKDDDFKTRALKEARHRGISFVEGLDKKQEATQAFSNK